jgi:ribonucrease Y
VIEPGIALGIAVGAAALGVVGALLIKAQLDRKSLASAQARSQEILRGAEREAGNILKAAELTARDQALKLREKVESELSDKRNELRRVETKLDRKEEALDRKSGQLEKRDADLATRADTLEKQSEKVAAKEREAEDLLVQQKEKLSAIAELSPDEAREIVLSEAREDAENEAMTLLARRLEQAKETASSPRSSASRPITPRRARSRSCPCRPTT